MSTPTEFMMRQISILAEARDKLQRAIDNVTSVVNPDEATWKDVTILAHIVDAVKRAELA